MGQASSTTNAALNDTISQSLTDIMNSTLVSTTNNINSSQLQDVTLTFDGPVNCNFDFNQTINVVNKIYSNIDAVKEQEIKKTITEDITNNLDAITEQALSGIPFGANVQDTSQVVDNNTVNQLSTAITNSLTNNINNAVDNSQEQKLNITFRDEFNCDDFFAVSQNIAVQNVIDTTLKDKNVTDLTEDMSKTIDNTLKSEVSQTLKGLDPFAMIAMIAIAVIVVVCGIIGLAVFLKMRSKKTVINNQKFGRRRR